MVDQTTTIATPTALAGGVTATTVSVTDIDGTETGFVIDAPAEPLTPLELATLAGQLSNLASRALAAEAA